MTQSGTIPRSKTDADFGDGYAVNEIFYSLQGEGVLSGTPMLFVRFAGCNLRCSKRNSGFDCDTDFSFSYNLSREDLLSTIAQHPSRWVLLTGGEPALQADQRLIEGIKAEGKSVAIETNGTLLLAEGIDHICVCPKSTWGTIRQYRADELKFVRSRGQDIPSPEDIRVNADHYIVSPACQPDGTFDRGDIEWCIKLVKKNPQWRLSMQTHKLINIK